VILFGEEKLDIMRSKGWDKVSRERFKCLLIGITYSQSSKSPRFGFARRAGSQNWEPADHFVLTWWKKSVIDFSLLMGTGEVLFTR